MATGGTRTTFKYDLADWHEMMSGERNGLTRTRCWSADGREVKIISDKYGEGWYVEVYSCGNLDYKQTAGTLQYQMPRSESGMRRELRKLWHETYGE